MKETEMKFKIQQEVRDDNERRNQNKKCNHAYYGFYSWSAGFV